MGGGRRIFVGQHGQQLFILVRRVHAWSGDVPDLAPSHSSRLQIGLESADRIDFSLVQRQSKLQEGNYDQVISCGVDAVGAPKRDRRRMKGGRSLPGNASSFRVRRKSCNRTEYCPFAASLDAQAAAMNSHEKISRPPCAMAQEIHDEMVGDVKIRQRARHVVVRPFAFDERDFQPFLLEKSFSTR